MNHPGSHDPRGDLFAAADYAAKALSWLVDVTDRIILPAIQRIEAKEKEIMATQAEFKAKLQAFFTEVETRLANVQKAIDDAIAAHVAGDAAAFDSLSQDVADELAKISTTAQPLATDTGATPPAAPVSGSA